MTDLSEGLRDTYYLQSTINVQGFSGFCRKLALMKTQQSTDKSSEHRGRTAFSLALVLLIRTSTGMLSTSSYCDYPLFITLVDENYPFSVTTASGQFNITPFWVFSLVILHDFIIQNHHKNYSELLAFSPLW